MIRRFAGVVPATLAGVISIAVLTAEQPSPSERPAAPIRLRAATFTPARGESPAVSADMMSGPARAGRAGDFLVQFQGPVLDVWKAALSAAGADILEYVPDFAFRVRMSPDTAAAVRDLSFVAWVGPYHPAYKLDPGLARSSRRAYVARLERGSNPAAVLAGLAAAGVQAIVRGNGLMMIAADGSQLDAVAQVPGIASVENFVPRVKHNEFGGGVIMGSNVANTAGYDGSTQMIAVADTGLGNGTAATAHPDLPASRVASIFNWPGTPDFCFETIFNDGAADVDSGHGTHVSTAALGGGNGAGVGRGTAPGASLVFQSLENYTIPSLLCSLLYGIPDGYYLVGIPADIGDLFQQAYDAGARVHSDSWGSEVAGAYTTDSQNADAFLWSHRQLAVTFSAGNAGIDFDSNGVIDPMSISSPGTAKNVITVGASENDRQSHWECDTSLSYTACAAGGGQNNIFSYGAGWPDRYPANPWKDDPSAGNAEQMAAFSSRGPTADGRIKPDVVAPGTWTLSGYANPYQQQYDPSANPQNGAYQYDGWGYPADQFYKYMGGTSMAAPLVAGGAAVVRDFYQKVHSHSASAALVKATLINSAADLLDENNDGLYDNAYPIPNMHEGWGRVDLANATDGSSQFDDETSPLSTGGTATFTFPVATPGLPFKASIAWTDYPSSASTAVNLVNDLDLTVIAPDGTTTYLGNAFAGGWATTGGSPDRRNNVENVYIYSADAGVWTVVVTGYNVPNGPQTFALVVDSVPGAGSSLPIVRASAFDATATEVPLTTGSVRVTRSGDTTSALTVNYTVGGSATAGSDYVALSGSVTIPEGASEVIFPVTPIDDPLVESPESIVVQVSADPAYSLGSPSSAVITLTSNDLPPDLVVTTVTAPAYAALGGTINVTDTTRNGGATNAGASDTGFYLSTNSLLEPVDIYIGSRPVPALIGGATDTATTPITIPVSTPPGNYYVIAAADLNTAVAETSELNNIKVSGMVRVGPDLQVTVLTAPATAAAGDAVLVGDTTKNAGAGMAAATVTSFYLSTNQTWDVSDTLLGSRPVSALAENIQESATTSVIVPLTTQVGTYYVLAKADGNLVVAESAENNNVKASAAIKIGADLTMTALVVPAMAGAGDAIQVTDTTKNSGGGDSPDSSTTFYLSLNSALDAADVMLGSHTVPELIAGAQHNGSVVLTVPLGTTVGNYYVIAKADGLGEVAETSETNNTKVSTAMKVGPDLNVFTFVAPATGGSGEGLSVTDTVKNLGGGPTPATESAFFLSTNGLLDASDSELGRRVVLALAPGATDVATVPLVLPPGLAPGNYYILSVVDPDNAVAEVLETNNLKSSAVVRVGPDLTVFALTGPSITVRGATITLNDTTKNLGGGAAGASTVSFYLSTNGTIDAADVLLGSRPAGALAAGASEAASTPLTIPTGVATGNYYVIAKADDTAVVAETSETNNTKVMSLRINP